MSSPANPAERALTRGLRPRGPPNCPCGRVSHLAERAQDLVEWAQDLAEWAQDPVERAQELAERAQDPVEWALNISVG